MNSAIKRIRHTLSDRRKLAIERVRAFNSEPNPTPILVFGNQKSGTSAIAALLGVAIGERTQVDFRGAWEPYISPVLAGRVPIAEFVKSNAYSFSAGVVKEPYLTFAANKFIDYFDVNKSIFIVRDPFQNIRSILHRLDIAGDLTDFPLLKSALPNETWFSIMSGRDLGLSGHYIDVQAHRWLKAVDQYEQNPDRYLFVKYEDFRNDKKVFIEELASQFGYHKTNPIDHLLDRAFQKRGNPNVDIQEFFGEKNHQKILNICGDAMVRLKYIQ